MAEPNGIGAARSRFRVTAANEQQGEQETELFLAPSTPAAAATAQEPTKSPASSVPPTPEVIIDNQYGDFFGPNFYTFTMDEQALDKELARHNSTTNNASNNTGNTTTTNSSCSSGYYNTIYKYNKLKLGTNNDPQGSIEVFPVYRGSAPNALVGIACYNEKVLVYNFLQRPSGPIAIGYHIGVSILVVYCLVLTIMGTSKKYAPTVSSWLDHIDVLVILFFIVEFFARLWSSDCVSYYRGWRGKLRFFRNPIRMIDLIVIITSVGVLLSNAKGELIITSLRGVRFIQIFQMVRLDFKFRPWRMMASVVYSQRIHLAIVFYMGFLTLIFVSFLLYFVEKDHNENFESLSATMWWAVVTLTTIGYGDVTPITSTGKLLACVCSLIGVSIFALPAGILGTGLALKVQEQQRQLKMGKRKQPAARLIQSAWRSFVSEQEIKRRARKANQARLPNATVDGDGVEQRSALWKRFECNKNKTRKLNKKEMNSLHFVFAVKLLIARRNFVKAFKPVDVRDVLEQYAAGHADMLAKVKMMDTRLDRIQTNINNPKLNNFRFLLSAHLSRIGLDMKAMQGRVEEMARQNEEAQKKMLSMIKMLADQVGQSSQTSLIGEHVAPPSPCETCGCHLPAYSNGDEPPRSPSTTSEPTNVVIGGGDKNNT